jgi:hypothetical protein
MKTAGSENPDRYTTVLVAFRVFGTEAENTSCSMDGLDVEKKSGHRGSVFFLTPFIELHRWDEKAGLRGMRYAPSYSTCSRHKEKETGNAEA